MADSNCGCGHGAGVTDIIPECICNWRIQVDDGPIFITVREFEDLNWYDRDGDSEISLGIDVPEFECEIADMKVGDTKEFGPFGAMAGFTIRRVE